VRRGVGGGERKGVRGVGGAAAGGGPGVGVEGWRASGAGGPLHCDRAAAGADLAGVQRRMVAEVARGDDDIPPLDEIASPSLPLD